MFKKILLPISAAAVLSLVACGDSSSSDAGSSSDKVTCKVNKSSSDEFKMTLAIPDSGVVTVSAVKNKKDVTYSTTVEFDSSLPAKEIKAACEDAKLDNEEDEDASISCKDNSMTITTSLGSELSEYFSEFTATLEEECNTIQKAGKLSDYDEDDEDWGDDPSSSSSKGDKSSSSTALDPSKVGCEITESTDNLFAMTLVIPDSAIANYEISYDMKNPYYSTVATFDKSVSEKDIKSYCDDVKSGEDADEYEITCKDRTISIKAEVDTLSAAFLPLLSLSLAESCREIQETGKIPEDLDFGFGGNDGEEDDWTDEEEDGKIDSSSSENDDYSSSSNSDDNAGEIASSSSDDEHEYYKLQKGCSLDKDSDVWTITEEDSQIIYSFTDAGLKMVAIAYTDAGTSAACENALQEENPNDDGTYEFRCEGPYLVTSTTTFMEEAISKEGLYAALSEECENL